MDLGTIKSKLASNRYFTAEEFAFDVRLTFSNAMLYNPPDNFVHHMAKDLGCMFIRRWKLVVAKWKCNTASAQQGMVSTGSEKTAQDTLACYKQCRGLISSGIEKNTQDSRKASCKKSKSQGLMSNGIQKNSQCKKSDFGSALVAKRSMSLEEKGKLRKDIMEMLKGKMDGKLQTVLQKFGFLDTKKEKIDLVIEGLHGEILWELKRVLKDSADVSSAKDSEYKILSTQKKIWDCGSKILSTHARRLDLDSGFQLTEDSGSGLDEQNTCPSFNLSKTVTTAISGEGWSPLIDDEQALKRALRAAMLKSQRERLKRLQLEEEAFKARIREEQLKKEAELKRQREKQRETARLALQMMERTVELEDNLMIWKELEMLTQCSPTYVLHEYGPVMLFRGLETGRVLYPLEQLGLHVKKEFMADDDEETSLSREGGEEGEILGKYFFQLS